MNDTTKQLEQLLGAEILDWNAPAFPEHTVLQGQHCRVEPLNIDRHVPALFNAFKIDTQNKMWTYLPYGPFISVDEYRELLEILTAKTDQQFYAVIDLKTQQAVGVTAYLRINPCAASIEVGHLSYSPLLQKTVMATESMFLMMRKIFEAGYRRYEWKCDSLNKASRASALRLGFQFEGIFRQALIVKGRNRDTAWFSIIDSEWPRIETRFEAWLSDSNFDVNGQQCKALSEF